MPRPHDFDRESTRQLRSLGSLPYLPNLFVPEWRLFLTVKPRYRDRGLSQRERQYVERLEVAGYCCLLILGHGDGRLKVADFLDRRRSQE